MKRNNILLKIYESSFPVLFSINTVLDLGAENFSEQLALPYSGLLCGSPLIGSLSIQNPRKEETDRESASWDEAKKQQSKASSLNVPQGVSLLFSFMSSCRNVITLATVWAMAGNRVGLVPVN